MPACGPPHRCRPGRTAHARHGCSPRLCKSVSMSRCANSWPNERNENTQRRQASLAKSFKPSSLSRSLDRQRSRYRARRVGCSGATHDGALSVPISWQLELNGIEVAHVGPSEEVEMCNSF